MALETGLAGKRALITGGARGIGFAIASALGREGVYLTIADIDPSGKSLEELARVSPKVVSICVDVSREQEAVERVGERWRA